MEGVIKGDDCWYLLMCFGELKLYFYSLKTEDLSELESYNEVNFEQMNENGVEIDENDKIKSTFLSALA